MRFSDSFTFGVATAAFQIEGSPLADGASPSIWYDFSHRRRKIARGENADVACDHYHRYREDIDHLERLGVDGYRFSVSWPRIVPSPGTINEAGLDFYDRLVDGLAEKSIEPFITLFHWDTPRWMEELGGFTAPEVVPHFLDYAKALFNRLGDRVHNWITINEPMVHAGMGYIFGKHAPGRLYNLRGFFRATHHMLLAHARTVELCRALLPGGSIGISEAQPWIGPWRPEKEKDRRAASMMDALINRLFIDPITHGSYPEETLKLAGARLPEGWEKDMESMNPPMDFVGINYYTGGYYAYRLLRRYIHAVQIEDPNAEKSPMWEVHPEGLYKTLMRLKREYGDPVCYITENGFPIPEHSGPLYEDTKRIAYLRSHLEQLHRAMHDGVDCRGYFLWTLMDNFEWDLGYDMRFGIIRVDFDTLERRWRRSAEWYRDLIASREMIAGANRDGDRLRPGVG